MAESCHASSFESCDVEDCCLTEAGHRILDDAVQVLGDRAQETISSVLREDAAVASSALEANLNAILGKNFYSIFQCLNPA